jgi:uncharacterized protein (TIGR02231 family)
MRSILALACLSVAFPAFADDFDLNGKISRAVIFAQGASITRTAPVNLPVGRHRLTLMVREEFPEIRFEGSGSIAMLAREAQERITVPAAKTADVQTLEAAYDAARLALAQYQEQINAVTARQSAAQMRMDFLAGLATGKGGKKPLEATSLLDILALVDSQTQDALSVVAKAKTDLVAMERRKKELKEKMEQARVALEHGTAPDVEYTPLVLDVSVTEPFAGQLVSEGLYQSEISWRPVYEVELVQQGDKGNLLLNRKAAIRNYSNEGWHNVELVLSTARISDATETWEPQPQLRGLIDPKAMPSLRRKALQYAQEDPEPVIAPMVQAMESDGLARNELRGQTVVFNLGAGNALGWNAQFKLFDLDQVSIPVDLYAMANAASDDVAFLYTDMTNETGGVILEGQARLYRDGALIGDMTMPLIYPGAETHLGLGKLLGVQIEHHVLNAMDGESGFITSSSEQTREVQTVITSRLDYPITLKLLDVVPTSENEDLVISMDASPQPAEKNRNGKRGVLEWQLNLQPKTKHTVNFSYKMQWPKGKTPVDH